MTGLFPQIYPDSVYRIITLDNRRMPLPLQTYVFSLRFRDQPADVVVFVLKCINATTESDRIPDASQNRSVPAT
jgi:hypothetical protein